MPMIGNTPATISGTLISKPFTVPVKVTEPGRKVGLVTVADRMMMKSLGSVLKLLHWRATARLVMGSHDGQLTAFAVFCPAASSTAKLFFATKEPLPSMAK